VLGDVEQRRQATWVQYPRVRRAVTSLLCYSVGGSAGAFQRRRQTRQYSSKMHQQP